MLTTPRWTHVALPSLDLDASVAWYAKYTPLVLLDRRADAEGETAWLAHERQVENPFVLVLVAFEASRGVAQPQLGPFAHLGIEVPRRADVDRLADLARGDGCLHWEPTDVGPPVGYVCALTDPDGNVIEISHDQGVYAKVAEVWGRTEPRRAETPGPDEGGVGARPEVAERYYGAPARGEMDARAALRANFPASLFPAHRDELVEEAQERYASEMLVAELRRLPDRAYDTVGDVWDDLVAARRRAAGAEGPAT
jgi:catechol 2,3-dioxygenase-like lactoylglutathione lyase family enzyme